MAPKRTKLPLCSSLQRGRRQVGVPPHHQPPHWQRHHRGGGFAAIILRRSVSRVLPEPQGVTPPGNGARASPRGREMGENPGQGLGSSGQGLLAQVDGEEVPGHEVFRHHVVKDRGGSRGGDAGESQPQDAIKGGVVEEIARLGLRQPEDLVEDLDVCDLVREMGRGRGAWFGQAAPRCPRFGGMGGGGVPRLTVTVS